MTIKNILTRYWPIFTITVVGFCIRLWASIYQPIFSEEAFSLFEAKHWPPPYDPSYPPGYPMFLKFWTNFSTTLTWARLPNVIAGTLSIIIFWHILKKNFPRYADIGALLLAFSALHIHYSWVARPHAFMWLASMISMAHLLEIAKILKRRELPPTTYLLSYFLVNSFGALISHGYTMYLGGSLIALIVWAHRIAMLSTVWKQGKLQIFLISLHALLPIIQYSFIHDNLQPLIDSAAWIPDFSISAVISVFLTLLNSTKTLNGELFASAHIAVYITAIAIIMVVRMFCVFLSRKSLFSVILFLSAVVVALASVVTVYKLLDMTILQPRLLLPLNTLYILSLTVTIPELLRLIRRKGITRSGFFYESVFLAIFLAFGIRSNILLNFLPYYNHPDSVAAVTNLQYAQGAIAVFPRYETITVHYLFGLNTDTHALLAWADKLHNLKNTTDTDAFIKTIPVNTPMHVVLWPQGAALTPGAQAVVDYLMPRCQQQHFPNLVILDCAPLAQIP